MAAGIAEDKVASGITTAHAYAEDAWTIIQSYIDAYSYTTLGIVGTGDVDTEIDLDPALTTKPLTAILPSVPDFPDTPDINDDFTQPDVPTRPDTDFPDKPTLKEHVIPDPDAILDVPEFTDTLPEIVLEPIQEADVIALFGFLVNDYQPQVSEIKAILLDRVINGGTGLPADIEDEIWERNEERDQQALQDAVDAVTSQWAKMGFSLPDGALADSLTYLNTEYMHKRTDTSRDIAIKQAELEQTNINMALQLIVQIEVAFNQVLVQYISAASDAMKTAAELSVALFNSVVQYYNLLIEVYQANLMKYRELMNARLADVEIYKARVQAVGAAIAADDAKVRLYVAQIEGETAKLQAYETEIRGVLAQIENIKAWLEVGRTRMGLYASETQALVQRYTGELEGYKTEILGWSAENETMVKEKDIDLRRQIAEISAFLEVAKIRQNKNKIDIEADISKMKTITDVGAHIVAGALAAAHTSASVSEQYQESESQITYL